MALTRSMLKAMGIEEEKIDQIVGEHAETVEALKSQRDEYKTAADELAEAKQRIAEVESQLEDSERYKARFEDTRREFDEYKASVESEKDRATRESLYREILRDAGIADKRLDSIIRVTDLAALEIGEDGKLADAEGLKDAAAKEWADFVTTTGTRGADVANPPANPPVGKTKEQIMAITNPVERQRAIAENIDKFNE